MDLYELNVLLLVLTGWCVPWWVYNRFIRTREFHPMGTLKFPTPRWMSCAIPYVSRNPKKNKCENVKFDGWTLGHVAIYFTLGAVLPSYWLPVAGLSVACEAFEYAVGWRARWIIDPLANLAGYALGHLVSVDLRAWAFLGQPFAAVVLTGALALILYLNRPSMIPRGMEFY